MDYDFNQNTADFVRNLLWLANENKENYLVENNHKNLDYLFALFKIFQEDNVKYNLANKVVHLHEEDFPFDLSIEQESLNIDLAFGMYDMVSTLTKYYRNEETQNISLNSMVFTIDLRIKYFRNYKKFSKINIDKIFRIGYCYNVDNQFIFDYDNQKIKDENGLSLIMLMNLFLSHINNDKNSLQDYMNNVIPDVVKSLYDNYLS